MIGECEGKEEELIELRAPKDENGHKKRIDYEDTPEICTMRENVRRFNEILDQADIYLVPCPAIIPPNLNLSRKRLHRVFSNGSFDEGGRFFGPWWQSISGELRKYIFIDGESTVELDYSALHAMLLYAQEGIRYLHDPYEYADPDLRDHLKLVLLCSLNAADKTLALKAIRYEMKQDRETYPQEKVKGNKLYGVVEEFLKHHAPISKYFYTGIGTQLQNLDSRIAESVMLELMEWGIFALPVHDSFICARQDAPRVLQSMKNAFLHHTNGYQCRIKARSWLTPDEEVEVMNRFGIVRRVWE